MLFVLAFGLELEAANELFGFFEGEYNIATWESRLILSSEEREVTQDDFALAQHVQDLFSVIDAVGVIRPALVGYCSGAGIALSAARQRPETFSSMILVHGEFAILKDESCVTQILMDIDSIFPIASMGRDKAQFILERVSSLKGDCPSDLPPQIDLNRPFSSSRSFYRYALNYVAYRENDFESIAGGVTTKTLVMTGDADIHTNVSSALRIANAIRGADVFVDKDADHYGVVRHQSNTLQAIQRFLRGV